MSAAAAKPVVLKAWVKSSAFVLVADPPASSFNFVFVSVIRRAGSFSPAKVRPCQMLAETAKFYYIMVLTGQIKSFAPDRHLRDSSFLF